WPDREPTGPFGTIVDSLSPRYVALLIAAALRERRRTGRGRFIDFAQIEAAVYTLSEVVVRFSANGEVLVRRGNRDEHAPPCAIYPCLAERFIAIAVTSDDEWSRLTNLMGWSERPRWGRAEGRRADEDDLDAAIAAVTREKDAFELAHALQEAGIGAGVVETEDDLLQDPQLAHRKHFHTIEHRHLGTLQVECSGIRLSETPPHLDRAAPD